MLLRPTLASDAAALASIYGDAALHGLGTFEETPPSPAEMEARRARVAAHGLPHLVGEIDGEVAGYACAAPFRPRPAYRFTVEDSVYVAPHAKGRGVGRALLQAVIAECEAMGLRRMIALVGDSGNAGSIRLHEACGFERMGALPAVGFKHGRWVDVVFLQRALGAGDLQTPSATGLSLEEP